jgi:16S rRNA (cytosine967-C5)-methyltransferase
MTALAPGADTLVAAVTAMSEVVHAGRSADDALAFAESRPDRSAVRAIVLGTLRWYLRLVPAMRELVDRPAEQIEPSLRALLVTAAHQIEYSRSAPEVSVHLAVDAARGLGFARATGFVNAVLRRFVREREALFANVDRELAGCTAHPEWFVAALQQAWPEHVQAVLDANDRHPPMVLRVTARDEYIAELAAEGRESIAIDWCPSALQLAHATAVSALPGFRDGRVSVQDAGAQLAARLLETPPGARVLDACAAPGGKTGHILECQPQLGELLAVDLDDSRISLVRSTLTRLGARDAALAAACAKVRLRAADLAARDALGGEAPFDRILLDAPCSATGVIRRHPDIKLLRRESDLDALVVTQRRLLERCFARLAPGGRLVYATCSVLPRENEELVQQFLAATPAAIALPWPADVALPPGALRRAIGVQLLPGVAADADGFYYAVLGRRDL